WEVASAAPHNGAPAVCATAASTFQEVSGIGSGRQRTREGSRANTCTIDSYSGRCSDVRHSDPFDRPVLDPEAWRRRIRHVAADPARERGDRKSTRLNSSHTV